MKKYQIRYMVEPWDKPIPEDTNLTSMGGVVKRTDTPYGYTDEIILVSVVNQPDGGKDYKVFSSIDRSYPPSPQCLDLLEQALNHYRGHTNN
jgi:hypothetical protein